MQLAVPDADGPKNGNADAADVATEKAADGDSRGEWSSNMGRLLSKAALPFLSRFLDNLGGLYGYAASMSSMNNDRSLALNNDPMCRRECQADGTVPVQSLRGFLQSLHLSDRSCQVRCDTQVLYKAIPDPRDIVQT